MEREKMTYAEYHNKTVDDMAKYAPEYYRRVFLASIDEQKQYAKQTKRFYEKNYLHDE